jgi:hypothetical protein
MLRKQPVGMETTFMLEAMKHESQLKVEVYSTEIKNESKNTAPVFSARMTRRY